MFSTCSSRDAKLVPGTALPPACGVDGSCAAADAAAAVASMCAAWPPAKEACGSSGSVSGPFTNSCCVRARARCCTRPAASCTRRPGSTCSKLPSRSLVSVPLVSAISVSGRPARRAARRASRVLPAPGPPARITIQPKLRAWQALSSRGSCQSSRCRACWLTGFDATTSVAACRRTSSCRFSFKSFAVSAPRDSGARFER
ncbi:hypothetical protein V8C86DRAFT_2449150 [Haematococcus lacustris]